MRDYVSRTHKQQLDWIQYRRGYVNESTIGGTSPGVYSGRADVTPTTPNAGGAYYRPTTYFAYSNLFGFDSWRYKETWIGNYLWADERVARNGWYHGFPDPFKFPHLPSASNEGLSALRGILRSKIADGGYNFGESLGELNKTINMLVKPLMDAASLVKAARRSYNSFDQYFDFLGRASTSQLRAIARRQLSFYNGSVITRGSRQAASAYLGLMYGLFPFMRDIHELLTGLEGSRYGESEIATVFAKVVDPAYTLASMPASAGGSTMGETITGKVKRDLTGSISFTIDNPALFELWRYGLGSPIGTMWELLTLSFVIDWFTNIGPFLHGLQQPLGLRVLHGYETYYEFASVTYEKKLYLPASGYTYEGDNRCVARFNRKAFARYAGTIMLPPLPYLRNGITSVSKAISALAIFVAAFPSRLR